MTVRGWGTALAVVLTLTACSGDQDPSPSAPTTPSASVSPTTQTQTPPTTTTTGATPSPTATQGGIPKAADAPRNDKSDEAAIETAKIALAIFNTVVITQSADETEKISMPQCQCRVTAEKQVAKMKREGTRLEGGPPREVRGKVRARSGDKVLVDLTYTSPAYKLYDAAGKVVRELPDLPRQDTIQLNFSDGAWRVITLQRR